jgi:hypothetical protein
MEVLPAFSASLAFDGPIPFENSLPVEVRGRVLYNAIVPSNGTPTWVLAIGYEAQKKAAKTAVKKRDSAKRGRLTTPTGSFCAKRDAEGQFSDLDEVGRSLRADRARKAKKTVKAGYGDQGDQPRRKAAKRTAKKR